jgi:biopolymer transport protein ExbB
MKAIIRLLCAALALASLTAAAQEAGTAKPAAAPAVAPAAPAVPPPPAVSLDDAYRKEFAFLEAQKRELQARIADVEQRFNRDRNALEGEVSALEGRALAAQTAAEDATAALQKADQLALANADNSDLLSATFEQARATLDGFGETRLNDEAFAAAEDAAKVQTLFTTAVEVLDRFTKVQRTEGSFFLADGTEVSGTLIRYGNIAAFGVSPQGSGALAPVGGGRFRLWPSPSEASAKALDAGQTPALLQAFIFENPNAAVPEPEVKTAWSEAKKGGLIGYIILLLGAIAMGLVVLRAVFLHRAGASIHNILDAIAPAMKAHRIEEAIDAAKRFKGSAARVVTAALRGIQQALGDNVLDRSEREHLEDIVSESILHESTHLSRFGSVIMMVAAVAPLLGLLGTVTGMIQTFDVITEFGTSDPKLLSGGISTALVTTELGLIVAIPCLLFGNLLNGWAERIKDDMEKAALRAINLFQGNVAPRVTG